jgi:integrase
MPVRVPKYRHHKHSGQAYVELNGRFHYLGKFDSQESHEEYKQLIAKYLAEKPTVLDDTPPVAVLKVEELILRYFTFAKTYYVRNGDHTDEITTLRILLRRLRGLYGSVDATKFGPKSFRTFIDSMVQEGLSRKYINDSIGRVKRLFKWGVAEELIPSSVFHGLSAVSGLRKGRSQAKETDKILPVADEVVDATLPFLPEVVADMVRLQRLAGMRPAEVCIMRPCDIDRSSKIWIYKPQWHKTDYADKDRSIPLGPKAQGILLRYLARDAETYCFRPCDSEAKRRALQHLNRKTAMSCGNRPGACRVAKPKRKAGERYDTASYRRAIQRACDKAFPHPTIARRRSVELTAKQCQELQEWRSDHRWAPNQLRHSAGTAVRKLFGLEASQVMLGHSSADVTQIYAERDMELAVKVAKEVG